MNTEKRTKTLLRTYGVTQSCWSCWNSSRVNNFKKNKRDRKNRRGENIVGIAGIITVRWRRRPLWVGGRFERIQLQNENICPVFLPAKHQLTTQLKRGFEYKHNHCGTAFVLKKSSTDSKDCRPPTPNDLLAKETESLYPWETRRTR